MSNPYTRTFTGTWISVSFNDTGYYHPTQSGDDISGDVTSGSDSLHFTGNANENSVAFSVKIPNGTSFNYLDYSGTFIDARHVNGTITVRNNPSIVTALADANRLAGGSEDSRAMALALTSMRAA